MWLYYCILFLIIQIKVSAKEPSSSIEVEVKAEIDNDRDTARQLSHFEKQLIRIRNNFKGMKRNKISKQHIKRTENVTTTTPTTTAKDDGTRPFTNFLLNIMSHFMMKNSEEVQMYALVFKRALTNTFMADYALYMLGSTFVALMTNISEYATTVPAHYLQERINYIHSFVANRNEKFHKDLNDLFNFVEEQYTNDDSERMTEILIDLNNPSKRRLDVVKDTVKIMVTQPLLRLQPFERDKFAFSLSNVIKNSKFYDEFIKKNVEGVITRNSDRKHKEHKGGALTKLIQNVIKMLTAI